MGCWLCRGQGSSQAVAAHVSERSSFRLTSSGTTQWRLRQLHRRPGGFSARLPALELQPRQGVHGRRGQHLSVCCVRGPGAQAASWPQRVSSPPSPSVSAAASGRLASRPRVPHHHRSHGCACGGHARGRLAWVFGLAVVELLVGVWLDQRVAVPFAVASQS